MYPCSEKEMSEFEQLTSEIIGEGIILGYVEICVFKMYVFKKPRQSSRDWFSPVTGSKGATRASVLYTLSWE